MKWITTKSTLKVEASSFKTRQSLLSCDHFFFMKLVLWNIDNSLNIALEHFKYSPILPKKIRSTIWTTRLNQLTIVGQSRIIQRRYFAEFFSKNESFQTTVTALSLDGEKNRTNIELISTSRYIYNGFLLFHLCAIHRQLHRDIDNGRDCCHMTA